MVHALEWFLFGMFVWGCCLVMQAFHRRVAPESGCGRPAGKRRKGSRARRAWSEDLGLGGGESEREAELQAEVERLRKRIETLEAIVTDRKFQWDQELNG